MSRIENAVITTNSIYINNDKLVCKLIVECPEPQVINLCDAHNSLESVLTELFHVTDTTDFDELTGTYIRVLKDQDKIVSIGNIMKNRWIDLQTGASVQILDK